jgi:hypothetical protein
VGGPPGRCLCIYRSGKKPANEVTLKYKI